MGYTSPYLNEPFRVLGLDASADAETIKKAASELRELSAGAFPADGGDGPECRKAAFELSGRLLEADLPWLEPLMPSPEQIDAAADTLLSDPAARLYSRMFWYSLISETDKAAFKHICADDFSGAVKIWKGADEASSSLMRDKMSAVHNLAVCYTVRSVAAPWGRRAALEDLNEAVRWWNRCFMSNVVLQQISAGEKVFFNERELMQSLAGKVDGRDDSEIALKAAAFEIARTFRSRITEILEAQSLSLGESLGNRPVPLAEDGTPDIGPVSLLRGESDLTRLNMSIEQAEYLSAHYMYDEAVSVMDSASAYIGNNEDRMEFDAAREDLAMSRALRGLMPVKGGIVINSRMGFGTSLGRFRQFDEATRSFVALVSWNIAGIPIWYFCRSRVRLGDNGRWEFLGRYVYDSFVSIYNFFVVTIAVVLCVLSAFWIRGRF